MLDVLKITDRYERKARLYPALICSSPLLVSCYVIFPAAYSQLSVLVTILASIGLLQLMANFARDRGKRLEPTLYKSWGGMPSIKLLRHSDCTIHRVVKTKYHEKLSLQSGIPAPCETKEQTDPEAADSIYKSWSDFLRANTRNHKQYELLFEENINYGFRRNLLGVKPFCILFASMALIGFFLDFTTVYLTTHKMVDTCKIFAIFYEIMFLLTVSFAVTPSWVKIPAEAYAKRLVETID